MQKINETNLIQEETPELTVSLDAFVLWTEDPTTKAMFQYLEHALEQNKYMLNSRSLIQDGVNGQLKLNYYLGYDDAISEVLNIRNLIVETEVDND